MPYCPNCGTSVEVGMNFCPECGSALAAVSSVPSYTQVNVTPQAVPITTGIAQTADYRVLMLSRGNCSASNCSDLLEDLLGYSTGDAYRLMQLMPVEIARKLTLQQAVYIAQALDSYGIEVVVCNESGYVNIDQSDVDDVYTDTGELFASVVAALSTISAVNRVIDYATWSRPDAQRYTFHPSRRRTVPPRHQRRTFLTTPPAPRARQVVPPRTAPVRPSTPRPVSRPSVTPPPQPRQPVQPRQPAQPARPVTPGPVRPSQPHTVQPIPSAPKAGGGRVSPPSERKTDPGSSNRGPGGRKPR